jgi:hypothetical protein
VLFLNGACAVSIIAEGFQGSKDWSGIHQTSNVERKKLHLKHVCHLSLSQVEKFAQEPDYYSFLG